MKYAILFSSLLTLFFTSCSTVPDSSFKSVRNDNIEVNNAIKKAQSTSGRFAKAVTNPEPDKSYTIKFKVEEQNMVEHLWANPVSYKEGYFYGKIVNKPFGIKSVKFGDTVKAKQNEISDWAIYSKNGMLLEGGFTIKALEKY